MKNHKNIAFGNSDQRTLSMSSRHAACIKPEMGHTVFIILQRMGNIRNFHNIFDGADD